MTGCSLQGVCVCERVKILEKLSGIKLKNSIVKNQFELCTLEIEGEMTGCSIQGVCEREERMQS